MMTLIKISENKELKVELYTNKAGFEKIQEKFDIEIGNIFLPDYIKVKGGLREPNYYEVSIQGVIVGVIYLERMKILNNYIN